jgi:hypothetical protein
VTSLPIHGGEAAGCFGKAGFHEPFRAFETARRMVRAGKPVHPYRCEFCGLWHVGRSATAPNRRSRK